jgi:hypothetical protein
MRKAASHNEKRIRQKHSREDEEFRKVYGKYPTGYEIDQFRNFLKEKQAIKGFK